MITKPQFGRVARSEVDVAFKYRSYWDSLVGAYVFAEAAGGTLFSVGSGNADGVISGATWQQGFYGPELDFDGATDHVDLNKNFGFGAVGNPFTTTILFSPDIVTGDHQVLARFNAVDDLYQFGHGNTFIRAAVGEVGGTLITVQADVLSVGTYAHGHLVCHADNTLTLYHQGVVVDTGAAAGDFADATEFHIGNRGGDNAEEFDGSISLVTVHSRVRLAKEINDDVIDPFVSFRKTRRVFGFVPAAPAAATPWFFQQKVVQRRCA